jgi:hypothetical protein
MLFIRSHLSELCGYLPREELPCGFRRYLMYRAVYRNRYPRMPALLLAKAGFEIDPVVERLFFDKLLKSLNDVIGTFNVTGTADTYA